MSSGLNIQLGPLREKFNLLYKGHIYYEDILYTKYNPLMF